MRVFIEDFGHVVRNSRTEILIWIGCLFATAAFITVTVSFDLLDIRSIIGPPRLGNYSNLRLIVTAPIFENTIMTIIVLFFSKIKSINIDKSKNIETNAMDGVFNTAIIAGIFHYYNNIINGIYCFFLFYLMARIFAKNYNAGRGHPAFWVTVIIHAVNNAVPKAIGLIETLFS